ncbi:MAG: TIR domain-containing protein [Rhizomicrobium sp.]
MSDIPKDGVPYKYKAFLSYSHRDADWGDWLHKALETYPIPRRLVGTPGPDGPRPARFYPVFRDREELPTAHDLNEQIKVALQQSANLIVIGSPNSAASRWVNEEILAFKRLGRENRIQTLVVSGHPTAEDEPSLEELAERTGAAARGAALPQASFPRALKFKLGKDGNLSGERTHPLAADARPEGDGREHAKLKLIAGLLGLGFEELRRRDAEAKRARLRLQFAGALAVVAVILGVIFYFLRANTLDARSSQFIAEAGSELFQRDYAKAEIAAAEALTYRDTDAARKLLLAARLGGVSSVARSAKDLTSELNVFSSDGGVVAAVTRGASGVTISVLSPSDKKLLWRITLPSAAGVPDSIAFSEHKYGNRQIAAAWPENDAKTFHVGVWNLPDGRPTGQMRELTTGTETGRHDKRIPSMAFSPGRPWLATGGEDSKLMLWDLSLERPRLIWEQDNTHFPDVHGIAFNADGTLLASAGGDYLANIWKTVDMTGANYDPHAPYEAHTIKPVFTLTGHNDSVFVVAFGPDGCHLTPASNQVTPPGDKPPAPLTFDGGCKIASGGYERTIRIWDLTQLKDNQPQTVATLSGHDGTILALAFSDDGKFLTSGASDGAADLWDATAGRLLDKFKPDDEAVRSVSTPRFETGVHIGSEKGWSVWSVQGSSLVARLWNGSATIGVLAFDPTGEFLAASGVNDDGRIRVWNRSNRLVYLLDPGAPGEYINGVVFSPDRRWIVAGGGKGTIHVWDRTKPGWQKVPGTEDVMKHGGFVWGLCFDSRSSQLASSNQSPDVKIKRWRTSDWSMIDQTKPGQLVDSVYALVCDPVSGRIVAGDSKARVAVRDAGLGTTAETINVTQGEVNVWSLALADTPHSILSGNSDGHVYRWVPPDAGWAGPNKGEKIGTSSDDAKVNPTINSVAYDAKHGWVAAGGVGPSVELYDIKDLHHLRSLSGHDGTIWWVTFDPQGTRLAYGGLDGIVRVVDLEAMLRLDTDSPADIYRDSQRETGLTVEGDTILRLK